MDDLARYLAAQRAFTDRVHAVSADQWQLPTPDTDWSVADLVAHLVDEHRWAAPLLHGQDLDTAAKIVDGSRSFPLDGGIGADLAEEWDEAAILSADAFAADGALDRMVELSRGTTAARDYIHEMTFDLVVHGWDLDTAIGYSGEPLPDEVVEDVYELAKKFGDLSSSGFFDAPVEVPDDAPTLDKLIGLTGRSPN